MKPEDLLTEFKNRAAIAKATGVSQPSVFEWFEAGKIPLLRQYQLQVLTRNRLKADKEKK